MPHWTHSPQAMYVFAAYGVAVAGLLGLLAFSCLALFKARARSRNAGNRARRSRQSG